MLVETKRTTKMMNKMKRAKKRPSLNAKDQLRDLEDPNEWLPRRVNDLWFRCD